MIKNYFKIAIRNLLKQKGFSAINMLGLALGIGCCLMIALFVQYEFSFDRFHRNADQTYRVVREITGSGGEKRTIVPLNYSMAELLEQNFPEVEQVTRFSRQPGEVIVEQDRFEEDEFFLAEPSFFDIFDVEFLSGDPSTALQQPFSVVITRKSALRIFGDENPIGRTFEYREYGTFTVTGVVRTFPLHSHFRFNILASLESARSWMAESAYTELGYNWTYTYLRLPEGYNPAGLEQKMQAMIEKVAPSESRAFQVYHRVQPLTDIHLYSNYTGELQAGGSALTVYALMGIAILVLIIACFNYVNLSTARAIRRAREVGMRKTLGAGRRELVVQFLGESVLIVFISFLISLLFIEFSLPYFNEFTGRQLQLDPFNNPLFAWSMISLLLVGLGAGSYPAFLMSGYKPSTVLKGTVPGTDPGRSGLLRKGLVVFQFAISIFLIAATMVIYSQLQYAREKELGFDKERTLALEVEEPQQLDQLKQELSRLSGIEGVAAASDVPPTSLNSWRILPEGAPPDEMELMSVMAVDPDFLDVMNLRLTEGRNFSPDLAGDREEAIILNQAAVKWLGLELPIGTRFNLMNNLKQGRVIGVVEDFHITSIRNEIAPVFLHIWPDWFDRIIIKIESSEIQNVLAEMEKIWNERVQDRPFDYTFLDESFDVLYRQEERMTSVMTAGSIIAIIIACLGLLGLVSYSVGRRTREIGIRKVLGATAAHIIEILSAEFIKLFLTGFILAAPVIWYVMNRWLQDYAYRIEIGPGIFVMAGISGLTVAVISIGYQIYKAVRLNPVDSLRNE